MSENDTTPKKSTSQVNKAVFFTSALLIFLLVAFAAVFPDVADKNFKLLQQQILALLQIVGGDKLIIPFC
ncbi:hypothetical protein ESCOMMO224M_23280 [Escherichia coli]